MAKKDLLCLWKNQDSFCLHPSIFSELRLVGKTLADYGNRPSSVYPVILCFMLTPCLCRFVVFRIFHNLFNYYLLLAFYQIERTVFLGLVLTFHRKGFFFSLQETLGARGVFFFLKDN